MRTRTAFVTLTSLILFAFPVFANAQQTSCMTNSALYGTPGNYTFTVPTGVTQVRIFAIGGGGGGGAGAGGWGSGGGGGCGGTIAGATMTVTPGQEIPLYVGYGGTGGNGSGQCTISGFPWCGSFYSGSNGSTGGNSGIGEIVAGGGSWGRTGFYNLYNNYSGGSGGGSGGGGGGNGWPGFYETPGAGGTAGGQTNSQGAGGYCTGGGWGIEPASFITKVPYSPGTGGYSPGGYQYWGGGGGGGVVINGSAVNGVDGQSSPNNGGKGYGGGGGGSNLDNLGQGGAGAPGAVYIEWDGGTSSSCALSCNITFDQNPLTGNSTTVYWTSQNASLFYINNIGYVGGSGSAQVSSPGDYSGSVSGIGDTASCPAVLSGPGGNTCTPTSQICNAATGVITNSCSQTTSCQYGCSTTTNQCNDASSCQPFNVCDAEGHKVVNSCTGATVDDCAAKNMMCAAGQCVAPVISFNSFAATDFNGNPFTATGHLQAFPSLVHQGATSRLYWNVSNATSCTVVGDNGDGIIGSGTGLWNTLLSPAAGVTTSPITGQTTYTLSCKALPGATPSDIQESVIVNIVPNFQEL